MSDSLPRLILTGASGIVGRASLPAAQDRFQIYAIARRLGISHFIFASSVAACAFPDSGGAITETTPPDAAFPSVRSKKIGEQMMRENGDDLESIIEELNEFYRPSDFTRPLPRAADGTSVAGRSST